MKKFSALLQLFIGCTVSVSSNADSIDAIDWLIDQRNSSGYWQQSDGQQRHETSAAVLAGLNSAGLAGDFYQQSVSWLANTRPASVDGQARQLNIVAVAGQSIDIACQLLNSSWREKHKLWGSYDGHGGSYFDTALALEAIKQSESSGAVCATSASVNDLLVSGNDGWPYEATSELSNRDAVMATAQVLITLSYYNTSSVNSRETGGINWLNNQQLSNGSFNNDIIPTAMALKAYIRQNLGSSVQANNARSWLQSQQLGNGSWQNDPLTTGMVLQAFPGNLLADSDGDGLPDEIEIRNGGNPFANDFFLTDSDFDGIDDHLETALGSNPHSSDTDGDGVDDLTELELGTNINGNDNFVDSDGDGLNDQIEIVIHLTDPNNTDTDGDTLSDKYEVDNGLNPLLADGDYDGLNDAEELVAGTLTNNPDCDGDGLSDGDEVHLHGTDPKNSDTDGDGVSDKQELEQGTNPLLNEKAVIMLLLDD